MRKEIFDFDFYKDYLRFQTGPNKRRSGLKAKMAEAMGCHSGYISQVLHRTAQLSLEQGERLNELFGHTEVESHFFLLLIQHERAGTHHLKSYFKKQLQEIQKQRLILNQRLKIKESISTEDQARYYSSWQYSAIHMALTLPGVDNAENIVEELKLPLKKVNEILEFLITIGLIQKSDEKIETTSDFIFLEKSSPNIIRHHTNWRMKAIESFDQEDPDDLHYSGVVTLSNKDALRIKEILMKSIKSSLDIVKESKEESLRTLCIDLFKI
jgi:uncharacterized protein (TIGR02147 family)